MLNSMAAMTGSMGSQGAEADLYDGESYSLNRALGRAVAPTAFWAKKDGEVQRWFVAPNVSRQVPGEKAWLPSSRIGRLLNKKAGGWGPPA